MDLIRIGHWLPNPHVRKVDQPNDKQKAWKSRLTISQEHGAPDADHDDRPIGMVMGNSNLHNQQYHDDDAKRAAPYQSQCKPIARVAVDRAPPEGSENAYRRNTDRP